MLGRSGGRNKKHHLLLGYIRPSPDREEMAMKLQCYFHGTVCHSTPAHQKHTLAWEAIMSSGYVLFLGASHPYCKLKVCAVLTFHQERFPGVPDPECLTIFTEGNLREVFRATTEGSLRMDLC